MGVVVYCYRCSWAFVEALDPGCLVELPLYCDPMRLTGFRKNEHTQKVVMCRRCREEERQGE